MVDEIDLHISPVLRGDGIRLSTTPGDGPSGFGATAPEDPAAAVNLRCHPGRDVTVASTSTVTQRWPSQAA